MKTVSNRIAISLLSAFVIPSLCLIVFTGCNEVTKSSIWIQSPADVSTFESGDSIPFSMSLTESTLSGNACIDNGTIIQWTSSRDGIFWQEEISQEVCGKVGVTYEQEFSTSALSAGDHTITCRANKTDETGTTYNLATAQVRIYIRESQNTTTTTATDTTTTTTNGGNSNLDLTACTALDDLEVRAGEPEYWNNKTTCVASIILKNNGTRPIFGGFYTDDSTINTIDPKVFKRDGWVFLYLDPGREIEYTIQPSGWGYQPQQDFYGNDTPTKTVITSKATAVYSEDGCKWILNEDFFSDGVIDAPMRTRDVSGLDPCN